MLNKAITIVVGFVLVAVALSLVQHDKPAAERLRTDVVHEWLEAMRKGGDGFQYWLDPPVWPKTAFYAVESYEIVAVNCNRHIVRIHSSTQGGTPLVRLYEVMADGDRIYRVTAQGEDRDAATNDLLRRALPKEDADRIIHESRF